MTDLNSFAERYRTLSNAELLDILRHPADYQSGALEAANAELKKRQLTAGDINDAEQENKIKQEAKRKEFEKVRAAGDKVKVLGASLADTLNPIQQEKPGTDKYIKLISLFLAALLLYEVFSDFTLFKTMVSGISSCDESCLPYFLVFIILIPSIPLFWFRKKTGWTLAAFLFTGETILSIVGIYETVRINSMISRDDFYIVPLHSTSYTGFILAACLFAGMLWAICKKEIREVYKVDNWGMYTAIGAGATLTAFITFIALQ